MEFLRVGGRMMVMKKVIIFLILLFASYSYAGTGEWKKTTTSFTEFLQMKEYEIIHIDKREKEKGIGTRLYQYIYHIRGLKETIICVTLMEASVISFPVGTECYYEDY